MINIMSLTPQLPPGLDQWAVSRSSNGFVLCLITSETLVMRQNSFQAISQWGWWLLISILRFVSDLGHRSCDAFQFTFSFRFNSKVEIWRMYIKCSSVYVRSYQPEMVRVNRIKKVLVKQSIFGPHYPISGNRPEVYRTLTNKWVYSLTQKWYFQKYKLQIIAVCILIQRSFERRASSFSPS